MLRMVRKLEKFFLVLGIVVYNNLYRIEYCNTAGGSLIKLVSDTSLKKTDVYKTVSLGNTYS